MSRIQATELDVQTTNQCSISNNSPHFRRPVKRKRQLVSPYFSSQQTVHIAVPNWEPPAFTNAAFETFTAAKIYRESCDVFRKRWDNHQHQRKTEYRFYIAVRHLCSNNCYFRAYAPCREWYIVCKEVHRSPMENVLKEERWKCVLETVNPSFLFVNTHGTHFHSRTLLLRYLEQKSKARDVSARKCLFQGSATNQTKLSCENASCFSPTDSPYGLLEELFVNDPWKLLVSAIFLNRTSRRVVDPILHEFFQSYPAPETVVTESCVDCIAFLIQPLGLHKRRSMGIVAFSNEFLELKRRKPFRRWTPNDIKGMYHCGQYAADVFRLFYLRQWGSMNSTCDHALTMYLAYQREREKNCLLVH